MHENSVSLLCPALCRAFLLPFALSVACVPLASAQTGRTLTLLQAPELGGVGAWEAGYPQSAVGNFGWFLLAAHSPRTFPTPAPGFTVLGSCRIGVDEILHEQFVLFDASRTAAMQIGVPRSAVFQGLAFDVQTIDYEPVSQTLAWGDQDLELTIGQGQIGAGLDLVAIPPGSFLMSRAHYCDQTQPWVQVAIDYPFWIGKYEVTRELYASVTGSRPSWFESYGWQPRMPVDSVTFAEAEAFCALLTARELAAGRMLHGYVYRLPTEAEWERCCRAGTTTIWNVGNTISCTDARGVTTSLQTYPCGYGGCIAMPASVGSFAPNQLGLYDMHGNVKEWCYDSWDAIEAGVLLNPHRPIPVGQPQPIRSGSWNFFYGVDFGSGLAVRSVPSARLNFLGLRIVLAPAL